MKVTEENEKVGLKLNMQKTKIMASGPITSWQIDGETVETVTDLFWGAPKSLQMLTAALKLKDTYFLKEKLWTTLTHLKKPWCWERLKVGGEGDDRGWDGWMASLMWWTWVWVNSGSWWWMGRPGMLQSIGLQTVRHKWAIELNWTCYIKKKNLMNSTNFHILVMSLG